MLFIVYVKRIRKPPSLLKILEHEEEENGSKYEKILGRSW